VAGDIDGPTLGDDEILVRCRTEHAADLDGDHQRESEASTPRDGGAHR
jgi:hypothetical protein